MTATKPKKKAAPKAARLTRAEAMKMLRCLRACRRARDWFEDSRLSPQKAWERCSCGAWMLWLLSVCNYSIYDRNFSDKAWDIADREYMRLISRARNPATSGEATVAASRKMSDFIRKHYPNCPVPEVAK